MTQPSIEWISFLERVHVGSVSATISPFWGYAESAVRGVGATRCSGAANLPPAMRQIIPSRIWRTASHPLGKAAALDPRKDLRSLHSCAEQPDRQDFAKSSLPACPVLLRCRSACKRFLPDLLRCMASSWCAHIMAALLRKSIVACSRSCGFQGELWFCKKLWTFQNAKGFVSESSPYTLYKLKGVFLNRAFWKFKENSFFQRSPLPITI